MFKINDQQIQGNLKQIPIGVMVISVLCYIAAIFTIIVGIFALIFIKSWTRGVGPEGIAIEFVLSLGLIIVPIFAYILDLLLNSPSLQQVIAIGILSIIFGLFLIVVARGLWKGQKHLL